jgi:hypothetical protein
MVLFLVQSRKDSVCMNSVWVLHGGIAWAFTCKSDLAEIRFGSVVGNAFFGSDNRVCVCGLKNVSSEWQTFLTTGNECE